MDKEVLNFAENMQTELDKNSHKGDWREFKNINDILLELEWHKAKLYMSIKDNNKELTQEYISDCANILMFLSNNLSNN